jgi:hypothetical protein
MAANSESFVKDSATGHPVIQWCDYSLLVTTTKSSRGYILDEVKGISLLYLLMVRMKLKLIEQRQEPLSLIVVTQGESGGI